jgi:hypothetical protein
MKIRTLSKTARLILRDLSRADAGLYVYTIYRRFKVSPVEISKGLRQLVQHGVIATDGSRAVMTEKGRDFVKTARWQLWPGASKPWRQCPPEFKQEALPVNSPYAPQITLLDKRAFPQVHQMRKGK